MKKNLLVYFVATMATLLIYSCTNKNRNDNSVNSESPDMHTSEISLDWAGTYSGVMPCASCEGIDTKLTLNQDNSYTLISTYLGTEQVNSDTLQGTFVWEGNNIRLGGIADGSRSPYFKVEENRVRYLDLEGNPVEGELADYYILKKI